MSGTVQEGGQVEGQEEGKLGERKGENWAEEAVNFKNCAMTWVLKHF